MPKSGKKSPPPGRLDPIDWTSIPLKEFQKNFLNKSVKCEYSDDAIAKYYGEAEAQINTYQDQLQMAGCAPAYVDVRCPFFEISETPFPPTVQAHYRNEGFDEPLPMHAISWPYILSGQNFAGVAQCSRSSLAHTYALPALVHVLGRIETGGVAIGGESGPFALILTDSKKLAEHIFKKMKAYGKPLGIKSHLVSAGDERVFESDPMVTGLEHHPHIVVAFLGQTLVDLVCEKRLNLKRCSFLVLDDGCRLIKRPISLRDILGQIRHDRQIVVWTNAFTRVGSEISLIKTLRKFGFTDYVRLFFGSYAHFNNPHAIKHIVLPVTEVTRMARFRYVVQNILTAADTSSSEKVIKCLIFCNTPEKVKKLTKNLASIGLEATHFLKTKRPRPVFNETVETDIANTSTTDNDDIIAIEDVGTSNSGNIETITIDADGITIDADGTIVIDEFATETDNDVTVKSETVAIVNVKTETAAVVTVKTITKTETNSVVTVKPEKGGVVNMKTDVETINIDAHDTITIDVDDTNASVADDTITIDEDDDAIIIDADTNDTIIIDADIDEPIVIGDVETANNTDTNDNVKTQPISDTVVTVKTEIDNNIVTKGEEAGTGAVVAVKTETNAMCSVKTENITDTGVAVKTEIERNTLVNVEAITIDDNDTITIDEIKTESENNTDGVDTVKIETDTVVTAKTEPDVKTETIAANDGDVKTEIVHIMSTTPRTPAERAKFESRFRRQYNEKKMREKPTTPFWFTYTTAPLEDTNYSEFDFMLNFDFPIDNLAHFDQRVAKFHTETGGKGTIYTLLLDTDEPIASPHLVKFLQDKCQYIMPKLYKLPKVVNTYRPTDVSIISQLPHQQSNAAVAPIPKNYTRSGHRSKRKTRIIMPPIFIANDNNTVAGADAGPPLNMLSGADAGPPLNILGGADAGPPLDMLGGAEIAGGMESLMGPYPGNPLMPTGPVLQNLGPNFLDPRFIGLPGSDFNAVPGVNFGVSPSNIPGFPSNNPFSGIPAGHFGIGPDGNFGLHHSNMLGYLNFLPGYPGIMPGGPSLIPGYPNIMPGDPNMIPGHNPFSGVSADQFVGGPGANFGVPFNNITGYPNHNIFSGVPAGQLGVAPDGNFSIHAINNLMNGGLAGHFVGGNIPGIPGINPGNIGINPGNIDIPPGNIGLNLANIGMNPGNIGINSGNTGINPTNIGINPENIVLNPANIGMNPGNIGLNNGNIGINPGNVGVHPGNVGINPNNIGLNPGNLATIADTVGINPGKVGNNLYSGGTASGQSISEQSGNLGVHTSSTSGNSGQSSNIPCTSSSYSGNNISSSTGGQLAGHSSNNFGNSSNIPDSFSGVGQPGKKFDNTSNNRASGDSGNNFSFRPNININGPNAGGVNSHRNQIGGNNHVRSANSNSSDPSRKRSYNNMSGNMSDRGNIDAWTDNNDGWSDSWKGDGSSEHLNSGNNSGRTNNTEGRIDIWKNTNSGGRGNRNLSGNPGGIWTNSNSGGRGNSDNSSGRTDTNGGQSSLGDSSRKRNFHNMSMSCNSEDRGDKSSDKNDGRSDIWKNNDSSGRGNWVDRGGISSSWTKNYSAGIGNDYFSNMSRNSGNRGDQSSSWTSNNNGRNDNWKNSESAARGNSGNSSDRTSNNGGRGAIRKNINYDERGNRRFNNMDNSNQRRFSNH